MDNLTQKPSHPVIPGARGACVTCGMGYRTVRKANGRKDFAHSWELRNR